MRGRQLSRPAAAIAAAADDDDNDDDDDRPHLLCRLLLLLGPIPNLSFVLLLLPCNCYVVADASNSPGDAR